MFHSKPPMLAFKLVVNLIRVAVDNFETSHTGPCFEENQERTKMYFRVCRMPHSVHITFIKVVFVVVTVMSLDRLVAIRLKGNGLMLQLFKSLLEFCCALIWHLC